ncbi:MAG: right-handed parallel beta-helix repeat-containing protein [Methanobrevibacter sp.]|uniref:right-handed parallel beta-helix repeat-containing protein n=1 Tax=Methanobrevibacter sp. TaxID=66852 RepID=UPI0025EA0B7F|nr:right-handed parallel beta-helix repeat-containing protein [Methanobrevibacter sp.]MBR0272331.1 right-handed parallel beta-helix repeat-containing protein [Methanobrevibacter sp.]
MILIVFISINAVSANDNVTDVSEVILDTSDADLFGENMVYNATLTSFNNTPLNNQTIIFCINGVNYTRITDVNGSAFLNINLMDGIYPISTTFESQNNQQIINNNTIYVSHNWGTLIKENLAGSEIQKIIDSANSGDTLIFAGSTYNDVSLNVNKSLNIISIVKSIFNGNSASPVITVKSDNVNISNLVISSGSAGILIDGAGNVGISDNNIINNYNGISVVNSNDALILNNDISNSRNDGIYLKNSVNTNISYNTLLNNYNGIYFDEDVLESQIFSNYISKSGNDAISFAKSGSHTNMSYNILEKNENGIFIDMVGDEDLNIELNTIQRNDDNGIYFGANYRKTNETGVLNVANNSIVYNKEFNILGRDSIYMKIDLNTNWIASDNSRFNGVCEKIKFKKYHLNVEQVDGNTLSVSVDGIKTASTLRVSYNGGKNWQTVNLVDGKATMAISNDDGNVMFDYYESNDNYQYQLDNYVPPTPVTPVTPDNPQNPTNPDTPSSDSTQSNGTNSQSEQIEGNGTSSNPNSGSSQGQSVSNADNSNSIEEVSSQSAESSSSQAASQAVSSASDSQSVSKQISDPTSSIAKALNIDEEVVRIAGMGFILLLIIAVIGLYYRDDVKYMLNKRNGQ